MTLRLDTCLHGNLPTASPATATEKIPSTSTVLVSGFGSGGNVGEEIDVQLVEANAFHVGFRTKPGRRSATPSTEDG